MTPKSNIRGCHRTPKYFFYVSYVYLLTDNCSLKCGKLWQKKIYFFENGLFFKILAKIVNMVICGQWSYTNNKDSNQTCQLVKFAKPKVLSLKALGGLISKFSTPTHSTHPIIPPNPPLIPPNPQFKCSNRKVAAEDLGPSYIYKTKPNQTNSDGP